MKKVLTLLFSLSLFLSFARSVSAQNNKFGIHIIDENDLERASELVNSSGGKWGYVTIVIREDERDTVRWQRVFDHMRRLKLIPIVRLATTVQDGSWRAPTPEDATNWRVFLDSLNWVTKDRYIIVFNEPNHTHEWGGKIAPEEYALVVRSFHDELKTSSSDYFILPGALDLAAGNTKDSMAPEHFYQKLFAAVPEVFGLFDGWASHSYANPGFSGESTDDGKTSVRGYKWELEFLAEYGLPMDIKVFVTETGRRFTGESLSRFFENAYQQAWNDDQVVAVTPFLLNYVDSPFSQFSWIDPSTGVPREHFVTVQNIPKTEGHPVQIHSYELIKNTIPKHLVSSSSYSFSIELENTGQSIWSDMDGFEIHAASVFANEVVTTGGIPETEPGESNLIPIRIQTNGVTDSHAITFTLQKDGIVIGEPIVTMVSTVAPPALTVHVTPWFGKELTSDFSTLDFYSLEDSGNLITSVPNFLITEGMGNIDELRDVVPNTEYRIVLTLPYHSPSEKLVTIKRGENVVDFGRLLPLDLNNDGTLDLKDAITHWNNPLNTQMQLLPL